MNGDIPTELGNLVFLKNLDIRESSLRMCFPFPFHSFTHKFIWSCVLCNDRGYFGCRRSGNKQEKNRNYSNGVGKFEKLEVCHIW